MLVLTGANRTVKNPLWKVNCGKGRFGKPVKFFAGRSLTRVVSHRRMLVFMDRHISSTLGRSCAIQDEE